MVAFGIKQVIAGLDRTLGAVPATALCGGVALYLAGHIAFRLRNVGTLNRQRCVTAVLCLLAIPIATAVTALAALAILAALCVGLVSYEALRFADARARVRAAR
jgi:low temperature requirement protein LtrA